MEDGSNLGRIREDLRGASRLAFGKKHRLEAIAVAGAQQPPIWSRRLARSLDIGENQAANELANLVQMGALQSFPVEHDRRKIFQAVPHPIWGFARELLEESISASHPDNPAGSVAAYWATVLDGSPPAPIPA